MVNRQGLVVCDNGHLSDSDCFDYCKPLAHPVDHAALAEKTDRPKLGRSDWVDCPICGESDMRKQIDPDSDDGEGYIYCVNTNCGSNGGDNFAALRAHPAGGVSEFAEALIVDAFDLGFAWKGMLKGQNIEDSRAVVRTINSACFGNLNVDISGIDGFTDAFVGIVAAKKAIKAALVARLRAAGIGAGVVPEPTPEMCAAGEAERIRQVRAGMLTISPKLIYMAMLAAAPSHDKGQ